MAFFGLSAKNDEQRTALRALANDKPFTFITGPAGSGKTLIAMAVGLEGVIENRDYRKMIYTRMQTQIGENLGALPGSLDEKNYPFVAPFFDNLDVLSDRSGILAQYFSEGRDQRIYFDSIQTIRGRSIGQTYLITDESQNNGNDVMSAVASRAARGSKFVFLGNFAQVDKPALRKPENNGYYRLLAGMYEQDPQGAFFDHINLREVHRDPVVEVVERIFRKDFMPDEFAELEARGNV